MAKVEEYFLNIDRVAQDCDKSVTTRRVSRPLVLCANTAWNLANFRRPILQSLVAGGHRVIAAAAPDGCESELLSLGAEFAPLPIEPAGRNPIADLRLLAALIRLLRRERPAALMTFTVKPNIYGSLAARITRTPSLATVSGLGSAFLAGGQTSRLVERLYRLAFARAQAVFFQNDEDRSIFVESGLVHAAQVRRVAGSGIDLDRFAVAPAPANPKPVFLFVGRLLWDKGIREFIAAAKRVRERGLEAEFRIVGECGVDNPTAVTVSDIARWTADGTIDYLGPTDDVRGAIARCDCLVLPSYREGLPRSLLEGAAMGRPLIASDVPGCRDVVEHGATGLLCAPRSEHALADAIGQMLSLSPAKRRAMGLGGRAKVEREFAATRVVAAYRAELGL